MDWQAALDSPEALRAASCLSRLVLSGHRAVDLHADGTLTVRPAQAAEPLLAALAAMPALRLVEDVQAEVRWLPRRVQGLVVTGDGVQPNRRVAGRASCVAPPERYSTGAFSRCVRWPLSSRLQALHSAGGCGHCPSGARHVAHGPAPGAAGGCRSPALRCAAACGHNVQCSHDRGHSP